MIDSVASPELVKTCCAALYESDWARMLLGESFHPGGLALTQRLGELLGLGPQSRVLDVASGKGESALFLAEHFGCEVVGVDYSAKLVEEASDAAEQANLSGRVRFRQGDAEGLPFADASFDALICECAFCVFPDKYTAAREFARVLKPGGSVGMSDLTRSGPLPEALEGLLAWVACIADAQPLEQYVAYLQDAGLTPTHTEQRNRALTNMIRDVRGKLLGAELLVKLKQLDLPGVDFETAKGMARAADDAARAGKLGYALLVAQKPA